MVALLRAVNVGGRKLPMAELRALCGELGWTDVATYIQSGNVVFDSPARTSRQCSTDGNGTQRTASARSPGR